MKEIQNYNKDSIDARTFPQIWGSLSSAQQSFLRYQLTRGGFCSRATVWNWSQGVKPVSLATRKKVSQVLNSSLGVNTTHLTLFPN